MDNQSDHTEPKLWERKTLASAAVSALLAAVMAASVCAVRGETLALPPLPTANVSHGHTAGSQSLAGEK